MSSVKTSDIRALQAQLKTNFNDAMLTAQAESVASEAAFIMPTDQTSVVFPLKGTMPLPREWVGDRVANNAVFYSKRIDTKDYELTLEVPRPDIETDNTGLHANNAAQMGASFGKLKDALIADVLHDISGTIYGTGFDEVNLFSTVHVWPNGTYKTAQSNNLSNSALTKANLATAYETMRNFRDDNGKPLNLRPDVLLVPPALELDAADAAEVKLIQGTQAGVENPFATLARFGLRIVVMPELQDATSLAGTSLGGSSTTWYLVDSRFGKGGNAGVLLAERIAPQFESKLEGSEVAFNRNAFQWGGRASYGAGPGFWPAILRSNA